jgi:transposase
MKNGNTMGMDLGDRNHEVCVLNAEGSVVERKKVANKAEAIREYFANREPCRLALEAGTHSGWISRLLESLKYTVVVAQPRAVRAIWSRDRKNDVSDAEMLARLLRADATLLSPIQHRSEAAQIDLLMIKARDGLVQLRTKLINQVRGLGKSLGHRFPSSDTHTFAKKALAELPEHMNEALESLLEVIEDISKRIRVFDKKIEQRAARDYPETKNLQTVPGVGALTSLAYVLTLDDPKRFKRSRDTGPYLGLVPRQDQSGAMDKQLHITKAGDRYLRRLLVGSAQYILGSFGPECRLRSFGLRLAARGGKNAKKRAVVAVARKLAVLLHKLWISGKPFDAHYGMPPQKMVEVA